MTCTVTATNSFGDSAASALSNSVIPSAVLPGAPGIVTIAPAGSRQVSVAFAPPDFDGGTPITGYKASCGNVTQAGAASPILVDGVANGTPVSCSVRATNEIGDGPASALSNTVTPGVAPDAPALVVATRGDRQLSVVFVPGDDGGFAVSNFHAVCGERSADGVQSPLTVTGLVNGEPVTCTVTATNGRGTSPPSAPSDPVTPATVPGAPTIGAATRGNGQVSVTFTPSIDDGGTTITNYRSTCGTQSGVGMESPIVVTGLTNGIPVSCTITAKNDVGDSAPSAASNVITPATVPDAPRTPVVTSEGLTISIDFLSPLNDGGSSVTGYRATCGSRSVSGTVPPLTIADMPAGVPVSCSVVAANDVGDSTAITSNTVTPLTVPGAPTSVTITRGDGQVTVSFSPPVANGGSAITSYLATCGAQGMERATSPIIVTGLPNGVPVTCFVTAFNVVGNGNASAESNSVTPAGVPGAPILAEATGGDGSATLTFTAPASDNGTLITSYTADCTPGTHIATGAQSPLTVPGLVNGTEYQCSARATNEIGTGDSSALLRVTPRATADLSISNSNDSDFLQGGAATNYFIEVTNHGSIAVAGARVRDRVTAPLFDAIWVCSSGQGGGVCPASGSGDIDALVDLPAGTSVYFLLTASVARLPETPASNTATVTAPNDITDPDSANDSATDGPDTIGIFRSGFEEVP